jgi:hypothetical protein
VLQLDEVSQVYRSRVVATIDAHEGKVLDIFKDLENEDILWSIGVDGKIRGWNIKTFKDMEELINVE